MILHIIGHLQVKMSTVLKLDYLMLAVFYYKAKIKKSEVAKKH